MGAPAVSVEKFIEVWHEQGCSPAAVSAALGVAVREVYSRRARLQEAGHDLPTPTANPGYQRAKWTYPRVIDLHLRDAKVLVGGDLHVWRPDPPPIWHAFCEIARREQPDVTVINGDALDLQSISRHPRLRNQQVPNLEDELAALRAWYAMLPPPPPPKSDLPSQLWTLGNHCVRLDSFIANQAKELGGWVGGLRDAFPDWTLTYSVMVNDLCEIRHRFRGGVHTAYNNALHSGINCISNHTHQLVCTPVVDRRGTRWGVETGMLNDPMAPFLEYGEGAPTRQRAGFALLTFNERGEMLPPELCEWVNGEAIFRNKPVRRRVKAGGSPA